jgi:hypothetical protein
MINRSCSMLATLGASLVAYSCATPRASFTDGADANLLGDYETIFRQSEALAEKGNPSAQYLAGVLFNEGKGTPEDSAKAFFSCFAEPRCRTTLTRVLHLPSCITAERASNIIWLRACNGTSREQRQEMQQRK